MGLFLFVVSILGLVLVDARVTYRDALQNEAILAQSAACRPAVMKASSGFWCFSAGPTFADGPCTRQIIKRVWIAFPACSRETTWRQAAGRRRDEQFASP